MDKTAMRRQLKVLRGSLAEGERHGADALIARHACALPVIEGADALFTYLSAGTEVDTRAVIEWAWSKGKRVAIPRCIAHTNRMAWHWITSFDGLVRSGFGIDEPPADDGHVAALPSGRDASRHVAIVPGYSFDAAGYRIGYGGGFYDVFLPQFEGASVGLCRRCQISDGPLPRDDHDIPVDFVVTEDGATATRR